jgi:hypothetical protein
MLFTLKDVQKYRLRTTDGDFGEIKTFLIDDFEWVVRYLVVEVGSRNVLLSVLAFEAPDSNEKVLPVNVSRERVMNSPAFDASQPISREIERQFSDYFEWPYYWEPDDVPNTMPGDLTAVPLINLELEREQKEQELIPETGSETNQPTIHLRSTQELLGATIHTTNDGHHAGKLVDFVSQSEDWNILYLVVETGGLLSSKKVLVSPSWVTQINRVGSQINVNLNQETINESPEFRSIDDLTQ